MTRGNWICFVCGNINVALVDQCDRQSCSSLRGERKKKDRSSAGVLRFPLPECQEGFRVAQKGADYSCLLEALSNEMRQVVRYQDYSGYQSWCDREKLAGRYHLETTTKYWQHRLHELVKEYGVEI